MLDIHKIQHIIKYTDTKCCGLLQFFVSTALLDHWDDYMLSHPVMTRICGVDWQRKVYTLTQFNIDIISNDIKYRLSISNFIEVEISMDFNCVCDTNSCKCDFSQEFSHAFILSNTNIGLVIVDSYTDLRTPSVRIFDYNNLLSFLKNPCIINWNILFETDHNNSCDYKVRILLSNKI